MNLQCLRALKNKRLIEILIVIIVLILLLFLSVPTFLKAQIRAKLALVKTQFEEIGKAMEAYRADSEIYPAGFAPIPIAWIGKNHYWQKQLTTPTPYLTLETMIQRDFYPEERVSGISGKAFPRNEWKPPITYGAVTSTFFLNPFTIQRLLKKDAEQWWILFSCGPDRIDTKIANGWGGGGRFLYDPSNGLLSEGDIVHAGGIEHDTRYGVLWDPNIPEEERKPGRVPWCP